MIDFITGTVLK